MSEYDEKSNKEAKYDSRVLISRDVLQTVIEKDFGSSASLSSFKVIDFVKPGDNYVCLVTSASCEVIIGGEAQRVSYVVKLNPSYTLGGWDDLCVDLFETEGRFMAEITPRLSQILGNIGEPNLRVPVCIYANYQKGKEMLITKDLREKHFKMAKRNRGLDWNHTVLVLEELARLHAAGHILKVKLNNVSLKKEFPFTIDTFLDESHLSSDSMKQLIKTTFETAIELLQDEEEYKNVLEWLRNEKENGFNTYAKQIASVTDKFETICHGDPWTNNFLFRYNGEGIPEEITMVDLQISRSASLSTDLNYFLYSSLDGEFRKENLQKLLSFYYEIFKKVIEKDGSIDMPFTLCELMDEFKAKTFLGLYTGMFIIPLMLPTPEEAYKFEDFTDENMGAFMDDQKRKTLNRIKTDPICNMRYMGIFSEIKESGTSCIKH